MVQDSIDMMKKTYGIPPVLSQVHLPPPTFSSLLFHIYFLSGMLTLGFCPYNLL